MTTIYGWEIQRGEASGLLFPVLDSRGEQVDITSWPCTAVVLSEPEGIVIHTFSGDALKVSFAGVHLLVPADVSTAITWRRGWFRVVLTDPFYPKKVSKVIHGPMTVTDTEGVRNG